MKHTCVHLFESLKFVKVTTTFVVVFIRRMFSCMGALSTFLLLITRLGKYSCLYKWESKYSIKDYSMSKCQKIQNWLTIIILRTPCRRTTSVTFALPSNKQIEHGRIILPSCALTEKVHSVNQYSLTNPSQLIVYCTDYR